MVSTSKIKNGLRWSTIEKLFMQGGQFVLSIVIARLVTPQEYGVLAILMVFVTISQVFIDSGLGTALVYEQKENKNFLRTTFTFNLIVSLLLFAIIFFTAPFIEGFYELPHLCEYLRVSSIVLISNSLILVPTSIFKIRMDFRSPAISNIVSTILSGIIGVILAYFDYGVWALVAQLISRSVFQMIILFIQCRWIPSFAFKKEAFVKLYKYGINMFGSTIVTRITDEGISFFIAKVVNPFSLGLYTRGSQFANLPSSCFGSVINTVMFPSFSSLKNDKKEFKRVYVRSLEYQAALSIPLYLFLAMVAEPLIKLLLTEKWIDSVPIIQILCIGRILFLMANLTEQTLAGQGRSDLFFKQQLFKMILKAIVIICVMQYGIIAIAIADASYTFSQIFITNYFAKINNFGSLKQFRLAFPYILSGLVACGIGYFLVNVIDNIYLEIIASLIVAVSVYCLVVTYIFKKDVLRNIIMNIIKR